MEFDLSNSVKSFNILNNEIQFERQVASKLGYFPFHK